jgi:hypothetical protein
LIVEFRNRTDGAILLRIGDGHKQVENIGLAEGDAVPVDLPVSGSLTVELVRPIKKQYCG